MFTLKDHARRNVRLAALGAAASVGMMAGTSQAAVPLQWDPSAAGTYAAPVGGPGNFNNTDANFVNPAEAQVAPATTDDVVIGGTTGGTVTVNGTTDFDPGNTNPHVVGTIVHSLTLSPTGTPYTIGGTAPIGFSAGTTTLSQTSGNNTITAPVFFLSNSAASVGTINADTGTNLTIDRITYSGYGWGGISKTGAGTVTFTSTMSNGGSLPASSGFNIVGGTAILQGAAAANATDPRVDPGNAAGGGGFHVQSGASLAGGGGLRIVATGTSNVLTGGHFAPGNNPIGSNFGTVGTFTLRGPQSAAGIVDVNLDTGSNLDLDLASLASYDSIALTKGSYGRMNFIVGDQAVVNINNGTGPLTPGTYHIITMLDQGTVLNQPTIAALNIDVTGGGFITGSVPSGYNYAFQNVIGSTGPYNGDIIGIDLVVTAAGVPEPASVALLGLGSGLLLLRKRRKN